MQYRKPPASGGPSGNTCPKCPSQLLQVTSVRIMPKRFIAMFGHCFALCRFGKGGPAAAAIIFGVGFEQLRAAALTEIFAIFVMLVILARESTLGALFTQNMKFFGDSFSRHSASVVDLGSDMVVSFPAILGGPEVFQNPSAFH